MILLFADETSDSKFRHYFGLSCAMINSNFYANLKTEFQRILLTSGWDISKEFKGSFIFSASKGDTTIPVEVRVQMAHKLLSLNIAKKNARMKFAYLRKEKSTDQRRDYLNYLPLLMDKVLSRAQKGQGKNVLALHCDYRNDICPNDIRNALRSVIEKKGFVLLEDIHCCASNIHTVGILFADIVGYLSARIDTIKKDSELFENIPPDEFEKNGKIRKYLRSVELIEIIKNFERYKIVPK